MHVGHPYIPLFKIQRIFDLLVHIGRGMHEHHGTLIPLIQLKQETAFLSQSVSSLHAVSLLKKGCMEAPFRVLTHMLQINTPRVLVMGCCTTPRVLCSTFKRCKYPIVSALSRKNSFLNSTHKKYKSDMTEGLTLM